jgi:hypothetical protein
MSRPPRAGVRASKKMHFLATPEEVAQIKQAAYTECRTVSDYIRNRTIPDKSFSLRSTLDEIHTLILSRKLGSAKNLGLVEQLRSLFFPKE